MRLVFVLSLAGAMVNTGFTPGPETQLDKFFGSYQLASLETRDGMQVDGKQIVDRFPAPPEPTALDLANVPVDADSYAVGGDPMVKSMIKTHRSVLVAPVPEVPIAQVCDALAIAAEEHNLPVAFLARLIWQESRFRQSAVSPVGAQGVAQFMPRIAAHYGLENPFDPLAAVSASARFLRELRDTFGNLGLAAAAYNGGSGRVQNWLARRNKLPEETRNYVKLVTGQEAEKWTLASASVDLAVHLPARAPCEGIAGLSRDNDAVTIPVALAGWVSATIRKAEEAAAAARAAAAKAKLLARAKGSKKSFAAKSKGKAVVVAAAKHGKIARAKAGSPNLVIAVIPRDKPAINVAAAKGGAKVAVKSSSKPSSKPIRLADARRSR